MRELKLTINNVDFVRFHGADLINRPAAPTHWTRYTSVEIFDAGTWLHFDVEADTEEAPRELNAEQADRRVSSVIFSPTSNDGDVFEINAINRLSFIVLRFRWRNPLTPASAGAWIRLILKRDNNRLLIVRADDPNQNNSRIWTFDTGWRGKDLPAGFTPAVFAASLAAFGYTEAKDVQSELLDRDSKRWLVDVSGIERPRDFYRLTFLPATDSSNLRPLAAQFLAAGGNHPVNGRALGSDPFSAASIDASSIELTCARREDGNGFIAEWIGVSDPAITSPRELSLDTLYSALARHYALGMASARSRNRLSFAPTRLLAEKIRLQFDVGAEQTLLRQIIIDKGTSITWVTGAASQAGQAVELTFEQADATPSLREITITGGEGPPAVLLAAGNARAMKNARWVVNGVAIDLETFEHASLEIRQVDGADVYGQSPVAVDFRLEFNTAAITPVSDDPEIGFETLSGWLDRERPIVIDLHERQDVRIEVHEFANASQSRTLRIGARSKEEQPTNYDIDAIVLDPSPFTAARVRSTTTVDPKELLAEYTDDSDQAPEWAFASAKGEMSVALPPQVIGEEMVKGRLFAKIGDDVTEVPLADKPFDFRLSPAARLILDRTDIDTARTLAPWSLRRLLGQRPGVVGVKLQKAQFELLYGLFTTIEEVPGLRVAELDALVGRIPFPDEFLDFLRRGRERQKDGKDPLLELRVGYCNIIAKFIRGMLYRPSWWPVFRDFTSRQQLTIAGKGVRSSLRPSRATANPFALGSPHDAATVEDERAPLRGGVDWPFQSRAIYNELLSKPDSNSVTIEGLAFGTLGGWGKQTAELNNGKTLIISETSMGRLDSVTVIRIGRIAMLWNRARHVIVYERSTRRAPRYLTDPHIAGDTLEYQTDAFDGFAALRKVREYIEITEQKRSYPDTSATRPIAGPLRASFHETTIIPVKSSWGRDVENGFVIALRGPMKKEEEKFFPFPKLFLKQARARGKGEGTVDHQLTDPSELSFFTSTREEDGGDSDQWPAVPDVDFPLVPTSAALPLPFKSRFARSRKQPDARTADFGQRRFTITVDPPNEAVDLMYGRQSEGIEARVRSVSLARGRLGEGATIPAGGVTDRMAAPMGDAHAVLHDGLSELRMQIAQARKDGLTTLADVPSFAAEAASLVESLRTTATNLAGTIAALPNPVKVFDWANEQDEWNRQYGKNLRPQIETWRRQLDVGAIADADEKKRVTEAALESVCQQVRQRVNEANFLPLQALDRIDIARKALERRIADFVKRVTGDLDAEIDRIAARYRVLAETSAEEIESSTLPFNPALSQLQKDVDAAFAAFDAALASFDGDALKNLIDNLGDWFNAGDTGLIADIGAPVRDLAGEVQLLALELISAISPVDVEQPNWEQLKKDCAALLEDFCDALVAAIQTPIDKLRAPIDALVEGGRLKILNEADDAVETACRDFTDAAAFLDIVDSTLRAIGGRLSNALAQLGPEWQRVPGSFDKVGDFRTRAAGWLNDLSSKLDASAPLERVEAEIEALSRTIIDGLESAARQVERAVVDELRVLGNQVSGAGLEVTRILATGPINDAIACTRDQLGYYYEAAKDLLDVTRASAIFNELGATVLNSLSAELPFDRIRDRLLPQLEGLDLGQLLPNFGGLKLEHLFPDLKAPNDPSNDNDWIRVRHGFDKDRLTAFANIDVDKVIDGTPAVFVLPPLSLKVRNAHFLASSRLELSSGGGKSQSTRASIDADWLLCLSDRPIVTLRDASLFYDSNGGFDFSFDSEKVELASEFQFITQALKNLLPQEEGLTLTPIMPAGIRAELGLPLPDLTTGAFTLTGITLYAVMELTIADGFEVRTGFWLSKPERPFGLAVLFLGGGGWVGLEVRYRPPSRFITRVSIGISAGAFVAINFGVARGSAGILFTAGVDFFRNSETQGGQTLITLGILVWGEFSILGIASASLRLMLSVTYDADQGRMIGTGRVELSIKICWCFTLRVSQTVTQTFAGKSGGGSGSRALAAGADKFSKAVRTVHSNVAL